MAQESLFSRLTKLFRSGPTIKRRVKGFDKKSKVSSSAVDLFKKHHSDVYNSTLSAYGSYDRMARYSDFAEMEATPEIASALDIYSEECVSEDSEGKCLHIRSDNRKVRELLDTLFYDTLNLNFNLAMWVRNLVKYGDFFLFNDVHPEFGVINAYPIPISEIEREEGFDPDDPSAVRFRWITQGNQSLENWQISHFRLLGNDAFLPYGSSVLESARRIWRQLILIEDAMLVYRVIRSPERRVFYIDVGNVPPEDIPTYVEQAKTALKRSQVVNKSNGQLDLRYNPMPVWKDTPIPLLDGRTLTIEELSKEVAVGKECWVYSIQDETNQLVPGKVSWCGKNYTADMMIKVWLDDDTYVMTAPEHPFVMRDGSSKRADELEAGDSLMPLYRKISNLGYESVYNPNTEKYEKTHQLIMKDIDPVKWEATKQRTVHHKEPWNNPENKLNNRNISKFNVAAMVSVAKREGLAKGYGDFRSAVDQGYRNHKVIRTEEVFDSSDVYCMTVIGNNGENDRHNFAVNSIDIDGNYNNSGIFVKNSVDEDYFIPVRGGDSGTRIDSLSGGSNTSAIEDVEYIQKKLFAALKIPKAYLGYDEDVGAKATLAQEDIRFSRTIQRIQKTIIAELNKVAMIHLYAHGFEDEDLLDFTLQLSNPSSLAQQQKLALIEQRFSIAGSAPEGMVSRSWIRKNVMGLSEDEILQIEREKIKDKLDDMKLEATPDPTSSEEPAGGDEEEAGGDDMGGDLFAADIRTGNLLNAESGKLSSTLKEIDEDDMYDDIYDDEIDLEKISGERGKIKPSSKAKNAWGEPLSKSVIKPTDVGHPDFLKMTSIGKRGRKQDTLNDPYEKDWLQNPFGNTFLESKKQSLADIILGKEESEDNNYQGYRPSLNRSLQKTLENMQQKLGVRKVLKESYDLDDVELDFELEEDNND